MSLTPPLSKPNITDYTAFIRGTMGINSTILPDNAAVIQFSLAIAIDIVSLDLYIIPDIYALAVYNLAGDRLLNFAQDLPGAAPVPGSDPPMAFFAYARYSYKINSFVAGVVQEAHDETTGETLKINDVQQLSLMDLQNLRTPFGRAYLQFAQMIGPTIWGLS